MPRIGSLLALLLAVPTSALAAVPAGVVVVAPAARDVAGLHERLDAAFRAPKDDTTSGPSALMRTTSSVALLVLSHAEVHDEVLHVPDPTIGDLHVRHVPIGGAIVVIAPLSRSIVAVSPVFLEKGVTRPRPTEARDDLGAASDAFVRRAMDRVSGLTEADAVGAETWQVVEVSITSEMARRVLGDELSSTEAALALAASDALAATGLVTLPAVGQGDSIVETARLQFAAIHGLAESEVERFTIALPAARNRLRIVIDGFASLMREGITKRARAYKAWATVHGPDDVVEGVAVITDTQLPPGIQSDEGVLRGVARHAMREAVQCALAKLVKVEVGASCEG